MSSCFSLKPGDVRRIFAGEEYEIRYELNGQTIYVCACDTHEKTGRFVWGQHNIACSVNSGALLSDQIFFIPLNSLVGDKMNYDEITKITAERISDYMTEAVNTDSKSVAEMFP